MSQRRLSQVLREPAGGQWVRRLSYHAGRWGLMGALAIFTYVLYPVAGGFETPVLESGQVSPVDVVAPFAFRVLKSPAELAREAGALAATVRPIYEYQEGALDSVLGQVEALFAALASAASDSGRIEAARGFGIRLQPEEAAWLAPEAVRGAYRRALLRLARAELVRGVPASGTVEFEVSPDVVVRRAGREVVLPRDSIVSFARYLEQRRRVHPAPNSSLGDQVFVKLIHGVFRPTLVPNIQETERLRAELRASADSVKDRVQANERIVAAHQVVTPEIRDRLLALRAELARRGQGRAGDLPGALGQILTNATMLAIFWVVLSLYATAAYRDLRQLAVLAASFALTVLGAWINLRFVSAAPELIPVPFAVMLIAVLFGGRLAMVAALVLAALLGTQAAYGGQAAFYLAGVGGVAAALGVRRIRRRSDLLTASGVVAAGFAIALLTVGLRYGWSLAELGTGILRGGVNGLVSAALVTIALPVFESGARLTTDLTLLELSDPNHPLLRRLATEAPGTYAHSIAMANLCEAACNAIGANGLLARLGCYYHDIGKLRRPQFFLENQGRGANPHDKLKPEVSANLIRNHVKDGLALAEEYRLPAVVRAFIPEHHGTQEIPFFLERARNRGGGEPPDPEVFRYPGPRPRSVETAVVMLADGVEAALRVLDDPSPEQVREAIEHLIEQRVKARQLAEAPLTLAQLERVREEFIRVLASMWHSRVDYPSSMGGINAEWNAAPAS